MAVNTNTLAGILAASKTTKPKPAAPGSGQIRYVPSYANPTATAKQNTINKSLATASKPVNQRGVAIPAGATNAASLASANAINTAAARVNQPTSTTTPVNVTGGGTYQGYEPMAIDGDPSIAGPVQVQPETVTPGTAETAAAEEAAPQYSVYDDPFYQQALQGAQSQFNLERIGALGTKAYQEMGINRELQGRPATAEAERRRLAGNYAARGMGGGRAGVLSRAEAEVNARELTARTGLREQMAELNRQFVGQFGADGSDWLGTLRGSQAQQAAIQTALQNRLAGLTTVG
jgi:hypothetical protein